MNLLHASILATAIAAGVAAPAGASGQVASTTDARFTALDRDNNDLLSLDEYAAEARARFDAIDIDQNRNITVTEMDTADAQSDGELSSAQKITLRDENKDGILAVDEHRAEVEAQFEQVDANGDGSIDLAELKSGVPIPVPHP